MIRSRAASNTPKKRKSSPLDALKSWSGTEAKGGYIG
jgi:hypothetical protein